MFHKSNHIAYMYIPHNGRARWIWTVHHDGCIPTVVVNRRDAYPAYPTPQWPLPGNHFLLFFPLHSAFWTISAFKPYAHSPHSPVSAFKAICSLRILISLCFQRTLRTLRTLLSDVSLLIIIVLLPPFDQFSVPIFPLYGHSAHFLWSHNICFLLYLHSIKPTGALAELCLTNLPQASASK